MVGPEGRVLRRSGISEKEKEERQRKVEEVEEIHSRSGNKAGSNQKVGGVPLHFRQVLLRLGWMRSQSWGDVPYGLVRPLLGFSG